MCGRMSPKHDLRSSPSSEDHVWGTLRQSSPHLNIAFREKRQDLQSFSTYLNIAFREKRQGTALQEVHKIEDVVQ